jgi:hypothetical protein
MEIQLKDIVNNKLIEAIILPAALKDMPTNWNFEWKELFRAGGMFFKLVLKKTPGISEGIIMLSIADSQMVYINNIESAPHNIGDGKKYDNVAGCLLAYACKLSFEYGRKGYHGFVSFDSKTKLIQLYRDKYGALHIGGQKMYFSPQAGKSLINKYLKE